MRPVHAGTPSAGQVVEYALAPGAPRCKRESLDPGLRPRHSQAGQKGGIDKPETRRLPPNARSANCQPITVSIQKGDNKSGALSVETHRP